MNSELPINRSGLLKEKSGVLNNKSELLKEKSNLLINKSKSLKNSSKVIFAQSKLLRRNLKIQNNEVVISFPFCPRGFGGRQPPSKKIIESIY